MTRKAHERPKVTVPELARMKALGEKICQVSPQQAVEVRDGSWPDDAHSYH